MPGAKKALQTLIDLLFSSTPTAALKTVLETAVEQIDPAEKTWEQLYVQAFQAAVQEMKPQLVKYAAPDGEVGLDKDRLCLALEGHLSLHNLAESDLQSPVFLAALTERLIELDALYIGGTQLSSADTRQLVENLVKRHASEQFKALVEHNEDAFRQAVRREALKTNTALDEAQAYLAQHHALTLDLLTAIHDETKAVHKDTKATRRDVKAVRRELDELPEKIADEIEARAAAGPPIPPLERLVFISYARADHCDQGRDPDCFVQKLYRALRDEGFTPWLDHCNLASSGNPFPKDLRLAIQQSERFIAICSPAYPGSDWSRAEREHADLYCIAITPVLFAGEHHDSIPPDIRLHNAVDMRAGFEVAWPGLLERLRQPVTLPGRIFGNQAAIPKHNPNDLPRPALFEQIRHALRADQTDPITISGTRAATSMYAAGGIGKTRLAAAIARDCEVRRGFPHGVVWMRLGDTLVDAEAIRITLGGYLGLPAEALHGSLGENNFAHHLQSLDALIILDDVWSADQVRAAWVEGPNLRYLITTRLANLADDLELPEGNCIKIDYLSEDEGVALIARRLGLDPNEEYPHKAVHREIVKTLGGHTQAIDLASSNLLPYQRGHLGPDYAPTLLEQLTHSDNMLFEILKRGAGQNREDNLLRSLAVSYTNLRTSPGDSVFGDPIDRQRYFRLLAVFAPGSSFEPAAAAAVWEMPDLERARRVLADLVGCLLVQVSETGDRYTLHALLHAAARVLLSDDERKSGGMRHLEYYNHKISALTQDVEWRDFLTEFDQHQQALEYAKENCPDVLHTLVFAIIPLLGMVGFHEIEEKWLRVVLERALTVDDHELLIKCYASMSRHAAATGREPTDYIEQILELSKDPSSRARAYASLIIVERDRGNWNLAVEAFEKSLEAFRGLLEFEQSESLPTKTNVAIALAEYDVIPCYVELKRFDEALQHGLHAVQIFRQAGESLTARHVMSALRVVRYRLGDSVFDGVCSRANVEPPVWLYSLVLPPPLPVTYLSRKESNQLHLHLHSIEKLFLSSQDEPLKTIAVHLWRKMLPVEKQELIDLIFEIQHLDEEKCEKLFEIRPDLHRKLVTFGVMTTENPVIDALQALEGTSFDEYREISTGNRDALHSVQLTEVIHEYLHLPSFDAAQLFLQRHPELLGGETDQCLGMMIQEARKKNEFGLANALKSYRHQLNLFRTHGIEETLITVRFMEGGELEISDIHILGRAFLDFSEAQTWEERRLLLAEYPELLAPQLEKQFEIIVYPMIQRAIQENLDNPEQSISALKLQAALTLLATCRDIGIDRTEKWLEEKVATQRDKLQFTQSSIFPLVELYLIANSDESAKNVIRAYPELRTPAVDEVFEALLQNAEDGQYFLHLFLQYVILRECRSRDIDDVFDEFSVLQDESFDTERFLEVIVAFVLGTIAERRKLVEENPLLLSPVVDVFIPLIPALQLEAADDVIEDAHFLLQYCRKTDAQAFLQELDALDEDTFLESLTGLLYAATWDEVRTIIAQQPALQGLATEFYLDAAIRGAEEAQEDGSAEKFLERLNFLKDLFRSIAEVGSDEAFSQLKQKGKLESLSLPPSGSKEKFLDEVKLFGEFVQAQTWAEAKQIIEENTNLLSDQMIFTTEELIKHFSAEDIKISDNLARHRDVLVRCRRETVNAVFSELLTQPKYPD